MNALNGETVWFMNFVRIKLFSFLSGEESFAKSKLSRGVTFVVLYLLLVLFLSQMENSRNLSSTHIYNYNSKNGSHLHNTQCVPGSSPRHFYCYCLKHLCEEDTILPPLEETKR